MYCGCQTKTNGVYFQLKLRMCFFNCNAAGGENKIAIDLIVKHVHLKLKEVY